MSSVDAQNVARKVSESIGKQEKVKLGQIIRNEGYALSTSRTPKRVTKTKSYQNVIAPILRRYELELDEILKAMSLKDKNDEQYRTLVEAADKIQKQIQLLSGGATENIAIKGVDIIIRK